MTRCMLISAALGLVLLAGCASFEPGKGFDQVGASVFERSGLRPHWNNGTQEDAQAAAAVGALLGSELSADGAVQVALLNNRGLQAVYEELNLAQADVVQAGLLRNPVFSGELRFASGGGGQVVVLDVAQDFVSLLAMPLHQRRAEAEFEAAKLRVTAAVLDAAFEVRTAFYGYQAAEQAREMRATVLEATDAAFELAKRLRAAGNFRELDLLNERAIFEQAKVDLAAAESSAAQAREHLNALMGLWGEQTVWRAAGRLPALPDDVAPLKGLEGRAIDASLDLALLQREVEIAARSAAIARPWSRLEGAEVGAAAEKDVDGSWTVGPSLSVPIPLFDQGQAAPSEADARYRQAVERTFARAVEVRARVRAAHAGMAAAHARARYYQQVILPLRQRLVDETQLQYNAMQVSPFQLLQARRDQVEAGAAYVASLHGYWRASAELDHVLAGRLTPFAATGQSLESTTSTAGGAGSGGH
ncbi:MAG: TolC family protein [Phycisphaerales bacterium]|nr:TolC family protein [Phycisphaerales bacterium]